ncbi:MAG: hypothetical protein Q4A92_07280 [Corynebacterium sp.]|nr:hypothetical protein [Corynebacterium sp.]
MLQTPPEFDFSALQDMPEEMTVAVLARVQIVDSLVAVSAPVVVVVVAELHMTPAARSTD